MEAIEVLKAQHRLIEQLFLEIERAAAPEAKLRLTRDWCEKIVLHMDIEESIFYPAVASVRSDLIENSYEEHRALRTSLGAFAHLQADEEIFSARLRETLDLMAQHIREEESELFPACLELLSQETLDELSIEIEEKLKGVKSRDLAGDVRPGYGMAP